VLPGVEPVPVPLPRAFSRAPVPGRGSSGYLVVDGESGEGAVAGWGVIAG